MPIAAIPEPGAALGTPASPGDVVPGEGLQVACADGTTLRVLEAQRAGGRAVSGDELARTLGAGARFE